MTFRELREQLFARGRFGIRPGLETISHLLERLGNPHHKVPVVQVAGTNGKGSTSAFLAAILQAGGYDAGLYTSPHLISYTERFRINGREIGEDELLELASQVLAVAPEEATFFELTTAMAFLWFARRRVDLAIMEVGMGGRLDATNAAAGILSVITPISLDHCRYLGDTLGAIAAEKAGIIKGGIVVCAPQDEAARSVIVERCAATDARLLRYGEEFRSWWTENCLGYDGAGIRLEGMKPGIPGRFQEINAACALASAQALADRGFTLTADHLRRGIELAHWPGRMERFPGTPPLLLDGAHNPAGVRALGESLEEMPRSRLVLLMAMMADKDREGVMDPLLALADQVVVTSVGLPQSVPAENLREYCAARGVSAAMTATVAEGLALARELASPDGLVLVTGSLYLVGEVRGLLLQQPTHPFAG